MEKRSKWASLPIPWRLRTKHDGRYSDERPREYGTGAVGVPACYHSQATNQSRSWNKPEVTAATTIRRCTPLWGAPRAIGNHAKDYDLRAATAPSMPIGREGERAKR